MAAYNRNRYLAESLGVYEERIKRPIVPNYLKPKPKPTTPPATTAHSAARSNSMDQEAEVMRLQMRAAFEAEVAPSQQLLPQSVKHAELLWDKNEQWAGLQVAQWDKNELDERQPYKCSLCGRAEKVLGASIALGSREQAVTRAVNSELRLSQNELREALTEECYRRAELEVLNDALTIELLRVRRTAADQVQQIEEAADTQAHKANQRLKQVERAADQERAQLEAVCDELRNEKQLMREALEKEAASAATERAKQALIPSTEERASVAELKQQLEEQCVLRDYNEAKHDALICDMEETLHQQDLQIAQLASREARALEQIHLHQEEAATRMQPIAPQVLDQVSQEMRQLQYLKDSSRIDLNEAWSQMSRGGAGRHGGGGPVSLSRGYADPYLDPVSKELAIESILCEGWSKLSTELFELVTGVDMTRCGRDQIGSESLTAAPSLEGELDSLSPGSLHFIRQSLESHMR